jgi:hypothetical protein
MAGANEFKTFMILKVPREVARVVLEAELGVEPWRAGWVFNTQLTPLRARADLELELELPTAS